MTTTRNGHRRTELTVGVGAGGLATADMVLNIGPQHPSTHGVLRLRIIVDGEQIVKADPIVGYMHRGAEKLFEVRDYRQIIVLANRHDWLSAFANELGVVLAVEQMLGMEVPERAVWARTLLAELNRVLSHLMFLGSYPLELGAITPVFYAFREREELQCGDGGDLRRPDALHVQPGRRPQGGPAGRLARPRCWQAIAAVRRRMPELESLLIGNEILRARTRGVGVLPRETGRRVRRQRAGRARQRGSTSTCAGTSRTWPTPSCSPRTGPGGWSPARRATASPGSRCCRAGACLARPGRRLPGRAVEPARRADQRPAAQGAASARGAHLPLDREPARGSTATTWSPAARRRRGG